MSDRLEELRLCRRTAPVAYHWFLINSGKYRTGIFLFVEGGDDVSFYRTYVERHVDSKKCFCFTCNGKQDVYKAYESITKGTHGRCKALFFVDKDFDDILEKEILQDDCIYMTDTHSIENYLVNEQVFFEALTKLGLVQPDEASAICQRFASALEKVHELARETTAWKLSSDEAGLSIEWSSLNFSRFIEIDDDLAINLKYPDICRYLDSENKYSVTDEMRNIRASWITKLAAIPPKKWVHGKLELWFMLCFYHKATGDGSRLCEQNALKLTTQTALPVLCKYADEPESLCQFFDRHFSNTGDSGVQAFSMN